jgi:hypothetical protein
MKARVENGIITQIYKRPKVIFEEGAYQPLQVWGDSARMEGWGYLEYREVVPNEKYYSRGTYTDEITSSTVTRTYTSVPRDIDPMKLRMLETVAKKAKMILDESTSKYSATEMVQWESKAKEAKEYALDNTSITPILSEESEAIGIGREEYATKVREKSESLVLFRIAVIAARSRKTIEILDLSTLQEIIHYENYPVTDLEGNTQEISIVDNYEWPEYKDYV